MGETILAIDDEKMNREFYFGLLKYKGYNVLKAENGEDALEILRNASVDLVLLDIMMPGISGFDVLKSIRENKKLQSLPVIIITALADKENRLKGLQLGADDFITKPFRKETILITIKRALEWKRMQAELEALKSP